MLNIKGLDASANYHLVIHDVRGNVVAETNVHNIPDYSWNIETISKGFYYLEIISDHKTSTVKFVKQ